MTDIFRRVTYSKSARQTAKERDLALLTVDTTELPPSVKRNILQKAVDRETASLVWLFVLRVVMLGNSPEESFNMVFNSKSKRQKKPRT